MDAPTSPPARSAQSTRLTALCLTLLLIAYAKILITEAVVCDVDSDEGMYSGAAWVVARGGNLYSDVVLTQTPASAYLYALVMHLGGYSLLLLRLVHAAFDCGIAVLMFCILARHGPGGERTRRAAGLAAVAVLAGCDLFLRFNVFARNYAPAIFFALMATLFVLEAGRRIGDLRRSSSCYWCIWAGVALGIAIQFKLTMLTLTAPLALAIVTMNRRELWTRRAVLPAALLVGAMLVSLIPTATVAAHDPDAFFFSNYGIHRLIESWRIERQHHGTGMWNKTRIWVGSLGMGAPAITVAAGLGIVGFVLGWRRRSTDISQEPLARICDRPKNGIWMAATAMACAATLVATYVWLTPTWPDYVTQVVPFLILIGAAGLTSMFPGRKTNWALAFWVVAAWLGPQAPLKDSGPFSPSVARLWESSLPWSMPARNFSKVAAWLAENRNRRHSVLCVYPAYLIAAGLPPTPELEGGITAMNVADRLPEARRRAWSAMSKAEMQARIQDGAYDCIVAGFTFPREIEAILATSTDWRLIATPGDTPIYVRHTAVAGSPDKNEWE